MNAKIAARLFTVPFLLIISLVYGLCHACDFAVQIITRPLDQPLDEFLADDLKAEH